MSFEEWCKQRGSWPVLMPLQLREYRTWQAATAAERERCAKEVEALHTCDCGPHWTERGFHSPTCLWAECQGIAQDLREATE